MAQSTQTGFTTTLAQKLLPGDTTMVLATAPTITSGRCKVNVGTNSEWVKFTGLSSTTLTGLVRGLSKTAVPATAGTGLTHPAGTVVKIVIMHDQLIDQQEDIAYSKLLSFGGTDTVGLRIKSLTTAQRDAITPVAGDKIFNTTTGTEQTYYGGVWNDAGTSTTPNASETVAGKGQVGDDTEFTNGALLGSTGAILWATLVQLAKSILLKPTTSTTSDSYYIGVNNGTIDEKITQALFRDQIVASTIQKGFARQLTDAEALAGNTGGFVNGGQAAMNFALAASYQRVNGSGTSFVYGTSINLTSRGGIVSVSSRVVSLNSGNPITIIIQYSTDNTNWTTGLTVRSGDSPDIGTGRSHSPSATYYARAGLYIRVGVQNSGQGYGFADVFTQAR